MHGIGKETSRDEAIGKAPYEKEILGKKICGGSEWKKRATDRIGWRDGSLHEEKEEKLLSSILFVFIIIFKLGPGVR